MGAGDGATLDWSATASWLVVRVLTAEVVNLGDKVKVPRGFVVACGPREKCVAFLQRKGADPATMVGGTAAAGEAGHAAAGYAGTATAGDAGAAMAGPRGTAKAGSRGTALAGDEGTATAGYAGTAAAGAGGTATAGYAGTAAAGAGGTATAGYAGTAAAGYDGAAAAGSDGAAAAGARGTATAGDDGLALVGLAGCVAARGKRCIVAVKWWDAPAKRNRLAVGYEGENGIVRGKWYRADAHGKLVETTAPDNQPAKRTKRVRHDRACRRPEHTRVDKV
jgi:hypothetical protein